MIEEILRERIAGGENEWTEFKRDFFSESDVLPAIVALANGAFEGWIIFGVTEEGEIEGVPDSVSLQDRLTTLCQQRCEPALPARVETVKTGSGTVVVLRIHGDEAAKPYRSKRDDTSWIRKGVQTEIVTPAEAEQFVEEQYRVFAPTLRQFCVEGFRSLYAAQLRLKPLNIIIGPNASGKSNLFKALRLVRDVAGEGIDKSYQEMGRHLFWYGDPGRKDTRFMLDMTVAVPGQQGRFAPRYWLGVKLAKDRLGIEEESLTLRLRPAESEVAFIERQGGKIQHYVERISSGASLEEPEHVSVQGKLPLRTAALATYGREATFTPLENLYRFIQGWRFLQVDPCAARASVIPEGTVEEIPALQDNGGNLSAFLYALRHNEECCHLFEEIQERLCWAIDAPQAVTPEMRSSLTGGPGKAELVFREKFFLADIPAESISDGTIYLLATLAVLIGDPNATLICLEEPDQGLHPHLMLRLADAIRSVVDLEPEPGDEELRRPQVIITTHSPDLMDCFDLRAEERYLQVFIARRDAEGKTVFEPVSAEELAPWLEEYRLGELARKNILDQGVF